MATKFANEQDFINASLLHFAENLIQQRTEAVRKTKSVASSELLNSYAYEIRKATTQQTALAMIAFEDSGRFLDMRRMNRTRQRPVGSIKEWIEQVGLSAFKKPTGGPVRSPVSNARLLNDLAWGIARKKKKHKRRPLQKGFNQLILELIDELRVGYLDRTVEQVKASFQKGKN